MSLDRTINKMDDPPQTTSRTAPAYSTHRQGHGALMAALGNSSARYALFSFFSKGAGQSCLGIFFYFFLKSQAGQGCSTCPAEELILWTVLPPKGVVVKCRWWPFLRFLSPAVVSDFVCVCVCRTGSGGGLVSLLAGI